MEQDMKYIYQVYQDGSFSTAAEHLYMSQPALSIAVKRVEDAIGAELFDRSSISSLGILLLATLRMTECRAEHIVDGDRENQRCTSDCKREVIGIVRRIAQRCFGILLNLNGCRRSKQSTDIDSHVEDREACIAFVLVLGIVIKVTHHYL